MLTTFTFCSFFLLTAKKSKICRPQALLSDWLCTDPLSPTEGYFWATKPLPTQDSLCHLPTPPHPTPPLKVIYGVSLVSSSALQAGEPHSKVFTATQLPAI